VSSFVESLGLSPQDTGDLKMAHWLEGAGLLIVGLAQQRKNFALSVKILG
jgi:predicted dinucleotide-binding enzyme